MDSSSSSGASARSTPITEQDVQRMLRTKDFYDILGVSKTATEDEIKRAYKKLALKYHPDKLRLPGAQEVFKKIAQAYDCLTNADKRAFYDRTGSDQPQQQQSAYHQHYQQDFDPNDIFNMFFGGGFAQQGQFRRGGFQYQYRDDDREHQQHHQGQGGGQKSFMGLFQLLPFLLILFSGVFSNLFAESPTFSLSKNSSFTFPRKSLFLNINYFVDDAFEDRVMEDVNYLQQFEWKVEQEYVSNLKNNCFAQQNKKRQFANQARMSWTKRDQTYYQRQSDTVDMTPCNQLDDFQNEFDLNRYF